MGGSFTHRHSPEPGTSLVLHAAIYSRVGIHSLVHFTHGQLLSGSQAPELQEVLPRPQAASAGPEPASLYPRREPGTQRLLPAPRLLLPARSWLPPLAASCGLWWALPSMLTSGDLQSLPSLSWPLSLAPLGSVLSCPAAHGANLNAEVPVALCPRRRPPCPAPQSPCGALSPWCPTRSDAEATASVAGLTAGRRAYL